ncbi:Uncharacterised protein [Mycobacteroides abscessus subsp. massiliense]|nr:Uncharacterised protein [Mycobacteroides abscessus subsp. massiliense]
MTGESTAGLHVFMVVDPVQEYREDTQVWGVYGSLAEAQSETPNLRRHWGVDDAVDGISDRYTLIEEWRGDALIAAWRFHPRSAPLWVEEEFAPRDPRYHRRHAMQPSPPSSTE